MKRSGAWSKRMCEIGFSGYCHVRTLLRAKLRWASSIDVEGWV